MHKDINPDPESPPKKARHSATLNTPEPGRWKQQDPWSSPAHPAS